MLPAALEIPGSMTLTANVCTNVCPSLHAQQEKSGTLRRVTANVRELNHATAFKCGIPILVTVTA